MRPRSDLGRFAHGQLRVDFEDRPDPHALRERENAPGSGNHGDAGPGPHLSWKDENARYLTGLRAQIIAGKSALLNGCLLFPEGQPVLLASGGEVQRARLVMPWIEEIHAIPIMEAAGLVNEAVERTIKPILDARCLSTGHLGMDESGFALVQRSVGGCPNCKSLTVTRPCRRLD
jgi:Xaa-Pro aminopeptidase